MLKTKNKKLNFVLYGVVVTIAFFAFMFSFSKVEAASDISNCTFGTDGTLACVDAKVGDMLIFWKYKSDFDYQYYTAYEVGYDQTNKVGDYYVIWIPNAYLGSTTATGTLAKLHDNKTTYTIVYQHQPITISTVSGATIPSAGAAPPGFFSELFHQYCPNNTALSCWIGSVYNWAQTAILVLSTGAIVVAGILWMTSAGDPKRLGLAKSILWGAFSAVIVIVLGRFFLVRIVGVGWI